MTAEKFHSSTALGDESCAKNSNKHLAILVVVSNPNKWRIPIAHRIHVWYIYIYANIWGILMVNVTIYSIHGSYGIRDTHELPSVLFSDVP